MDDYICHQFAPQVGILLTSTYRSLQFTTRISYDKKKIYVKTLLRTSDWQQTANNLHKKIIKNDSCANSNPAAHEISVIKKSKINNALKIR